LPAGTFSPIQPAGLIRPLLHDIRSPLSSIMALAHFASTRRPIREADILSTFADILSAARHLNELAEICLFVTKAAEERSGVDIAAIDLHEMIASLFLELNSQATAFGVDLHNAVDQQVLHGDTALVKTLFRFMIKSAVKYARNSDKLSVSSKFIKRGPELRQEVGVAFTLPHAKGPHAGSPLQDSCSGIFAGDGFFQLNLTVLFGTAVAASHRGEFYVTNEGQRTQLTLSLPTPTSIVDLNQVPVAQA